MSCQDLMGPARRLALEISTQLEQLELLGSEDGAALRSVDSMVNRLAADVVALEGALLREAAGKRDMWKKRVAAVGEECRGFRAAIYKARSRDEVRARELRAMAGRAGGGGRDNGAVLDNLADESGSLGRSHAMMDDMADASRGVMGALLEQRARLKGAQRKVLDMANTLGLSNFIIRAVERREGCDAMIVCVGMVLTTVLLVVGWHMVG